MTKSSSTPLDRKVKKCFNWFAKIRTGTKKLKKKRKRRKKRATCIYVNCISSNSCLKFRFSSKIHNTYFFLHVVLLLYFKDVLSTQKYCFAIFMYTFGWSLPLTCLESKKKIFLKFREKISKARGGNWYEVKRQIWLIWSIWYTIILQTFFLTIHNW